MMFGVHQDQNLDHYVEQSADKVFVTEVELFKEALENFPACFHYELIALKCQEK